ncbi:MAG: dihydrodipicolinate synthase family protein [Albidovulum sp.]|nr:dihydrodipicolinate synthase family protein [Albidovulum sp.]MDE0534146.1 dihydrodipicolinate synthase family protein [Albidovulum sp.]
MTEKHAPKGVYAAVATPVATDFSPDLPRFLNHCRWLLSNGCVGLAPLGTTGEGNSLGLDDRRRILDSMAQNGLPMDRVIAGTGSASIDDAVELSKFALDTGVNGLLMLPPFYYKNPSEDGLFKFFATVAERLAERSPRIFLYHFPQISAVPFTVPLTARLREAFPGVFVGLKDSGGDFETTRAFVEAFPGFEAFSGTETFAAENLAIGGWGCISATANLTAPIVARRIAEKDPGRQAELDEKINELRSAISSVHNIGGSKGALSVFRRDPDWKRVIPPNAEISFEKASELAQELNRIAGLEQFFRS